jgi:hypothetical protein
MGIVLLGVISLGFFAQSCYKENAVLPSSLESTMLSIENDAKFESKQIQEISISEANIKFFNEIKQNKDKPLLKSTNSYNVLMEENSAIMQVVDDYPIKEEDETLSDDETIILRSYFKCAKNKYIDKVLLTQYYLDKIDKLDVDEQTKYRCNACLSLIRDALIFTCDKIAVPRLKVPYEYNIADYVNIFEDCLVSCLRAKLDAIFNGTWVEEIWFIVNCPVNMLVYTASCTESCLCD